MMMMKSKNSRLLLAISGFLLILGLVVVFLLATRVMTDQDYINSLVPTSALPDTIWERVQASPESLSRTTVELRRTEPTSLVYLDFLRFDATTPKPETALIATEKIDDAWIAAALSSYDSSRRLRTCTIGDVRLYEYDAVIERLAYNLRYWVIPITPTRSATLIVAVTVDNRPYFDELSKNLRPNEPACP
ncbi:MAG TPA: hypothetical protein PLZ51_19495 [Aggregatilineales bacterium]|nr:hypothetical protein [Aggregatilineales bacterium]